jgi:hypothetical protein
MHRKKWYLQDSSQQTEENVYNIQELKGCILRFVPTSCIRAGNVSPFFSLPPPILYPVILK